MSVILLKLQLPQLLPHLIVQLLLEDGREILLDVPSDLLNTEDPEDDLVLVLKFVRLANRVGPGIINIFHIGD